MKEFDAIIIGFGKGGKTLAGDLAENGKTVAMIKRSGKMYGGTCINTGCIPKKSLYHSSVRASQISRTPEERAALYREAEAERERLTAMLRQKNFDKLNRNPNITVFTVEASFQDAHHVSVALERGDELLEAEQIFINTGSRPFLPSIPGLSQFCAESHEMINLIKLAMDARLPYPVLRDAVYTHPTMSEAFNELFSL